jgi:hypothetical protein
MSPSLSLNKKLMELLTSSDNLRKTPRTDQTLATIHETFFHLMNSAIGIRHYLALLYLYGFHS